MSTLAVTGGLGGLGANVVREAAARGLGVRALVRRDPAGALPEGVEAVRGDAGDLAAMRALVRGADALVHCANVNIHEDWSRTVLRMLDVAIEACRAEDVRLIFPANVWVYGPGRPGQLIDELTPHAATSRKGLTRVEQERRIRESGLRYTLLRLPEFYGPHVQTLTGPPLRAALLGRTVTWFGAPDLPVEFVLMPDAARAMVALAQAPRDHAECFHLPGVQPITPRAFFAEAVRQAGGSSRFRALPGLVVRAAGLVYRPAREFADLLHLWETPILLDGSRLRARLGELPRTPYADGIAQTLAWHRAHPEARMYY